MKTCAFSDNFENGLIEGVPREERFVAAVIVAITCIWHRIE